MQTSGAGCTIGWANRWTEKGASGGPEVCRANTGHEAYTAMGIGIPVVGVPFLRTSSTDSGSLLLAAGQPAVLAAGQPAAAAQPIQPSQRRLPAAGPLPASVLPAQRLPTPHGPDALIQPAHHQRK